MNLETWISISAAIAASVAICASYWSASTSRKALTLAEGQEDRRKPKLILNFTEGYVRYIKSEPQWRIYAFLLSVSNPSDINNSVANLDLHLTYFTSQQLKMTVKIPADASTAREFGDDIGGALISPFRVDSHQTIAGWSYFRVDEALLGDAVVDGYGIVATDSHELQSSVEPVIVREFVDEVQATENKGQIS